MSKRGTRRKSSAPDPGEPPCPGVPIPEWNSSNGQRLRPEGFLSPGTRAPGVSGNPHNNPAWEGHRGSHFTDGLRLSGAQGHTGQTTLPDFTPGVPQGCCRTKSNSLPRGKCLPRNHFLIVAGCPTTAHEFRRQSHVQSLIGEAKPMGNLCNESDIQQTKTCPASPAFRKTHASVIACSAH